VERLWKRLRCVRRSGEAKDDIRLVLDVLERGRNKGLWQKTNWAQLVKRHGTTQVARRLGYLLDLVGIDSSALLEMRGRSGTRPFSLGLPPNGTYTSAGD